MQTHERAGILNALRGLPEDLAAISAGPGRWSAIECEEHSQAQRSEAPVVNQTREAAILARRCGPHLSRNLISPEVGRPTGRFATLAEAVESFLATRERTVRFVETCDEDLRSKPAATRCKSRRSGVGSSDCGH